MEDTLIPLHEDQILATFDEDAKAFIAGTITVHGKMIVLGTSLQSAAVAFNSAVATQSVLRASAKARESRAPTAQAAAA